MKIDVFVQLMKELRQNSIADDTDPNNTILQEYTSPYDEMGIDDSVRTIKSNTCVWGDGTTYTAYDSNNQPYQVPSCGWVWGAGGRWQGANWTTYLNKTWSSLSNTAWINF